MKRIAIDMDEVIADFHPKLVTTWNSHFEQQLTADELNLFDLQQKDPHKLSEVFALASDPEFFGDLAVIADSQRVIARLSQHYDIFITTAAMELPSSFNAKFRWLNSHFPDIKPRNIVFCQSATRHRSRTARPPSGIYALTRKTSESMPIE